MAEIALTPDFIDWLIVKARSFELQDEAEPIENETDAEPGEAGDPTQDELVEGIDDLDARRQAELVALVWVGRAIEEGESPASAAASYDEYVATAEQEAVNKTSDYLLGMPMLPDYLLEGAKALELDIDS